jgi:hypothetical protein
MYTVVNLTACVSVVCGSLVGLRGSGATKDPENQCHQDRECLTFHNSASQIGPVPMQAAKLFLDGFTVAIRRTGIGLAQ